METLNENITKEMNKLMNIQYLVEFSLKENDPTNIVELLKRINNKSIK